MNISYVSRVPITSHRAYAVHVMHMCSAFANLGNKTTLYSLPGIQNDKNIHHYYGLKNNFGIHHISSSKIRGVSGLLYAWSIIKIIDRGDCPDLIYTRHLYSAFLAYRRGWRVIYEVHMPLKNIIHKLMLYLMINGDPNFKIVSITNSLKLRYLSDIKSCPNKCIIVMPDAAVPSISSNNKRVRISNHVGYIGNLFPGKGIELIMELATIMSDTIFHVIGGRDTEVNYWKKKINSSNVIFHGQIKHGELDTYYDLFDICLLPLQQKVSPDGGSSDIAPWTSPMKMFEYMAHNKAIIASDLPVLQEVLQDRYNSLIVNSSNPSDWKAAILELHNNNDLLTRIADNALFDLKSKYTWKKRCENIISLFQ